MSANNRPPSGFELNPVGYTGFFISTTNPATGDCFWDCRILEATEEKFKVETPRGQIGWIERTNFTPKAMRGAA